MTQQKPLPIATRITGGFNIPSFFYPEVLQRDKIWHVPLGKSKVAAKQPLVDKQEGRRGQERGLRQKKVFAFPGRSTGSCFPPTLL